MKDKLKKLYENYYLGNDNRNMILYERKVSDKGNIRYDVLGYYHKLSQLIKGIKHHFIINNITILEYDDMISNLEKINRL